MKNLKCRDCKEQVKFKLSSLGEYDMFYCKTHADHYRKYSIYYGEWTEFTGPLPKKYRPSSFGALKPM